MFVPDSLPIISNYIYIQKIIKSEKKEKQNVIHVITLNSAATIHLQKI